jgi:hypothetical protein
VPAAIAALIFIAFALAFRNVAAATQRPGS